VSGFHEGHRPVIDRTSPGRQGARYAISVYVTSGVYVYVTYGGIDGDGGTILRYASCHAVQVFMSVIEHQSVQASALTRTMLVGVFCSSPVQPRSLAMAGAIFSST
jgi:hypothetical protein